MAESELPWQRLSKPKSTETSAEPCGSYYRPEDLLKIDRRHIVETRILFHYQKSSSFLPPRVEKVEWHYITQRQTECHSVGNSRNQYCLEALYWAAQWKQVCNDQVDGASHPYIMPSQGFEKILRAKTSAQSRLPLIRLRLFTTAGRPCSFQMRDLKQIFWHACATCSPYQASYLFISSFDVKLSFSMKQNCMDSRWNNLVYKAWLLRVFTCIVIILSNMFQDTDGHKAGGLAHC